MVYTIGQADGAFILECSNTRQEKGETNNRYGRHRHNIIRPLAPFALNQLFVDRGIPSTVINYTDFWDPEVLADTLCQWAAKNNIKKPIILCSRLFNENILAIGTAIEKSIRNIRKTYPDAPLILGGPIGYQDYPDDVLTPDAVFHGRSLHLFEQMLDNKPLASGVCKNINGVEYYHHQNNNIVENPIVPKLYDDYCLDQHDIVMFETRLGCKFNCTFCAFEFRNAKHTTDAYAEEMYNFFMDAYNKYNVRYFSIADDTFNEDDNKITRLELATKDLNFKPIIVGYNRFDIMMAKPEQSHRLDACGFHGHYFGIETLHREASKLIRKGIVKERAFDFMRYLRDNFPHWWTSSGYIIGVPKEPKSHIMDVIKTICDEKLLKSIIPGDLGLYGAAGFEDVWSDFVRNPEYYGIEVVNKNDPGNWHWRHEHMDKIESELFAKRLAAKITKLGVSNLCPWEWVTGQAMGKYGVPAADAQIDRYIQRKIIQLS